MKISVMCVPLIVSAVLKSLGPATYTLSIIGFRIIHIGALCLKFAVVQRSCLLLSHQAWFSGFLCSNRAPTL
jgi:hypothetical protein